jgi:hypothetical protein
VKQPPLVELETRLPHRSRGVGERASSGRQRSAVIVITALASRRDETAGVAAGTTDRLLRDRRSVSGPRQLDGRGAGSECR